jgi:hypothetical protein
MKDVIFIPCNTVPYHSPVSLLKREISSFVSSWDICRQPVAIKVHFGEEGAVRFLRPIYVKPAADAVKGLKGLPFLTDTNTLYKSPRALSPSHLEVALQHGFSYAAVNCPVIIADGLWGNHETEITMGGKSFFLAGDLAETQYHIVLTHVTFHGFTGIAGAIKNIGMGWASKKGKIHIHRETLPEAAVELCNACGKCLKRCNFGALSLIHDKISLDKNKCTGCCHCMGVCLQDVFNVKEDALIRFSRLLGQYAAAAVKSKRILFVNFLIDMGRQCDCASFTHKPICEDIGILISDDILLVEGATLKLLNHHTQLETGVMAKFNAQLSAYTGDFNFIKNIRLKEIKQ